MRLNRPASRLAFATVADTEFRQALGMAIFFGRVDVTALGPIFIPTFYVGSRALGDRIARLRGHSGNGQTALVPAQ